MDSNGAKLGWSYLRFCGFFSVTAALVSVVIHPVLILISRFDIFIFLNVGSSLVKYFFKLHCVNDHFCSLNLLRKKLFENFTNVAIRLL